MINFEVLLSYSAWIFPPVIGALIGYVTNDIAIKMLFRPLKAKYIGALRLPFTPGIIPRQREKLADSIGLMVSRELITEDAIRHQISSPSFQHTLSSRVSEFTGFLMYTSFTDLQQKFRQGRLNYGGQKAATANAASDTPADTMLIQSVLTAFFRSESFFLALQKSVALALDKFFCLPLETLCGRNGERLNLFFSQNLRVESLRAPLRRLAGDLVEDGIQRNVSLDKFLTPQAVEGLIKAINRIYPAVAGELLQFLRTPHIHKTLEQKGRTVLRKTISRLSSLQRLFIAAGQYDRNIERQMDEIVDDLLDQLETAIADEETRSKLLDMLEGWLKRLRTKTLADIAGVWGESLPEDVRRAVDGLFHLAASPKAVGWMQELVQRLIDKYGQQEIGSILAEFTGHSTEEISARIADWISSLVEAAEGKGSTAVQFFRTLFNTLSNTGAKSLAEILQLEQQHKQRLDDALGRFIRTVLDEQVPSILESVDIQTLVVDKINSLDIEKVEELILIVIRTHLRWIILFGALLGFLIGTLQVGLFQFL
ncbi:MAG: DUF445 domain-containing protein [bacterium]